MATTTDTMNAADWIAEAEKFVGDVKPTEYATTCALIAIAQSLLALAKAAPHTTYE